MNAYYYYYYYYIFNKVFLAEFYKEINVAITGAVAT